MKIHHLNCMSFHFRVQSITHCVLVETNQGLVLVDTGLGLKDYDNPSPKIRAFMAINRVPRDVEETTFRQVSMLGYSPQDVKFIVLTHLHLDHSGGLPDFPWAQVHVLSVEHHAALHSRSIKSLIGYDATHWAHNPQWIVHDHSGDSWFGLLSSLVLDDPGRRILLIPLFGHSPGHCGVAIEVENRWLLHCGDAYVRDSQIDPVQPRSPFPKWAILIERALFPSTSIGCLRGLVRDYGSQIKAFSSHDPIAFTELRGAA
jgi:glyoxylase-like metal-dependent hydrolase (beta-lactamase superfamily II)